MTARPYANVRDWTWKDDEQNETPGIGIWGRRGLAAHLTVPEARTLADRIHDLCDASGNPEPVLPTTTLEQE